MKLSGKMSVVSKPVNTGDADENHDCKDWKLPLSFMHRRHLEVIEGVKQTLFSWRMKERMKTVSVALVVCLNVGVDPPDLVKTQPCARMECWIDPSVILPQKAIETIGSNLQKQYEKWQPRARYKQSLDPTADDVKKLCQSLRKNAKDERVLFHYNGHGVPMPTTNGEIWVFNKTYTQYIPLSIYDLQTYMGSPSIYVYDCSSAGTIIKSFKQFAEQHEKDYELCIAQGRGPPGPAPMFKHCIQLGACAAHEILPMNPDLPADLFTACLTTPIKVALRWYCMQQCKLLPKVTLDLIDKIPGQLNDRRTMLGELNWIFTAVTDTIAWNTLPRDVFQRLFRQDLLVASLFRNFLLAERVMKSYDCTPVSSPLLPPTHQHVMWQAWDLALEACLAQLPGLSEPDTQFQHSMFFEEQLTAFQVWLELGDKERSPPEQLPIVLQVLLSQVHRLRALDLLGRFLDLGPWAVNLALSVGIFPYVLKLLQSSARELRPLLVFIWAKILAVDNTCQVDLVRDNGHKYFLSILQDPTMPCEHRTLSAFVLACVVNNYHAGQEAGLQSSLLSICLEQLDDPSPVLRQWVIICLARLWDNYDRARWIGVRDSAHEKLYTLLSDPTPEVRACAVNALGTFISSTVDRSEHATNLDQNVSTTLLNTVAGDMSPLVRQQLVIALQWMVVQFQSSFISVAVAEEGRRDSPLSPNIVVVGESMLSPQPSMKRLSSRERMSRASSGFISGEGITAALELLPSYTDRMKRVASSSSITSLGDVTPTRSSWASAHSGSSSLPHVPYGSIYMKLWNGLQVLERDPHPAVKNLCHTIMERIRVQARDFHNNRESEPRQSSTSLPPSPSSRASYLTSESPPPHLTGSASELSRAGTRSAGPVTGKVRIVLPNTISEESDDHTSSRRALVTTEFLNWRSKDFAQPVMSADDDIDMESKSYYQREWRYLRNQAMRREGAEETVKVPKIEHQVFNARCPDHPKVVMIHPYETHFAVAARDSFGVWDWNLGVRLSYLNNRALKGTRITSMQWINSHDATLLLTGSDDGSARIWANYTGREGDPQLRTAFQALTNLAPASKTPDGSVGMVMAWDQQQQILATAGDTTKVRLWDIQKELKIGDLATGTDASITCISCTSNPTHRLLSVGSSDGLVRIYDVRMPPLEARVQTWRENGAWIIAAHLKTNVAYGAVVAGSVAGDVRFYDMRSPVASSIMNIGQGLTAMAVHDTAEYFCCGTVNQNITVYRGEGTLVNVIKYHDGFMGTRMGPISCLAMHPVRAAFAAGNSDSNLSFYTADSRR